MTDLLTKPRMQKLAGGLQSKLRINPIEAKLDMFPISVCFLLSHIPIPLFPGLQRVWAQLHRVGFFSLVVLIGGGHKPCFTIGVDLFERGGTLDVYEFPVPAASKSNMLT